MTEDKLREIFEQADPDEEITDGKRDEIIAAILNGDIFLVPNEAVPGALPAGEPVFAPDDWRGRAAYHAGKISKELNS